jgi:hypothetical protein
MKNKKRPKLSPIDIIMINWVGAALRKKKVKIAKKLKVEETELNYITESVVFTGENEYLGTLIKEPGFRFFSEEFKDFDMDLVDSVFPTSIGDYTAYLVNVSPCEVIGDFIHSASIGFVIRHVD